MRQLLIVLLAALPGVGAAEEIRWMPMQGDEIAQVLTGATVDYANA
ncbi:MAG: hypothetical protein AAF943_02400 [Pseudomonadota bacterium]